MARLVPHLFLPLHAALCSRKGPEPNWSSHLEPAESWSPTACGDDEALKQGSGLSGVAGVIAGVSLAHELLSLQQLPLRAGAPLARGGRRAGPGAFLLQSSVRVLPGDPGSRFLRVSDSGCVSSRAALPQEDL